MSIFFWRRKKAPASGPKVKVIKPSRTVKDNVKSIDRNIHSNNISNVSDDSATGTKAPGQEGPGSESDAKDDAHPQSPYVVRVQPAPTPRYEPIELYGPIYAPHDRVSLESEACAAGISVGQSGSLDSGSQLLAGWDDYTRCNVDTRDSTAAGGCSSDRTDLDASRSDVDERNRGVLSVDANLRADSIVLGGVLSQESRNRS